MYCFYERSPQNKRPEQRQFCSVVLPLSPLGGRAEQNGQNDATEQVDSGWKSGRELGRCLFTYATEFSATAQPLT
jgi:hypothetical protein